MRVEINGKAVDIDEGQYIAVPLWWLHSLSDADFKRMCLLRQRYDFFAREALKDNKDCDLMRVMWESQSEMGTRLGFSKSSRSRVGEFLARMEAFGIVEVVREKYIDHKGQLKPRHYTVVKDKNLLESYGRKEWTIKT